MCGGTWYVKGFTGPSPWNDLYRHVTRALIFHTLRAVAACRSSVPDTVGTYVPLQACDRTILYEYSYLLVSNVTAHDPITCTVGVWYVLVQADVTPSGGAHHSFLACANQLLRIVIIIRPVVLVCDLVLIPSCDLLLTQVSVVFTEVSRKTWRVVHDGTLVPVSPHFKPRAC